MDSQNIFCHNTTLNNFIVFEGADGSGRSTQSKLLQSKLNLLNIPAYISYEPTNHTIGKLIRNILLGEISVENFTLAHLFAADRNEHLYGKGGIIENVEAGKLVVSDRYFFSSLAYQGLESWALNQQFPLPELLFFFEIDMNMAEHRYKARNLADIYENRRVQDKVRNSYEEILSSLQLCSHCTTEICRINANKPVEEVFEAIWEKLCTHPIIQASSPSVPAVTRTQL